MKGEEHYQVKGLITNLAEDKPWPEGATAYGGVSETMPAANQA